MIDATRTFRLGAAAAAMLVIAAPGAAWADGGAPSGHAEAGHAEAHGDESLNWTDFSNRVTAPVAALVINFVLLVWLLVRFGQKPMGEFLEERRRTVSEEVDAALEEKLVADGRLAGVRLRSKNIEEELMHLREDLLRVGFDERDRLVADAGARAEKIRKEAAFAAAEEERRLAQEMRTRAVAQAVEAARARLRAKLTPADQRRIADAFAARIEQGEGT